MTSETDPNVPDPNVPGTSAPDLPALLAELAELQASVAALRAADTSVSRPVTRHKIPNFAGSPEERLNTRAWIQTLEDWFPTTGIASDKDKLAQLPFAFTDGAASWFNVSRFNADGTAVWSTWTAFKEAFIARWGQDVANVDQLMGKLLSYKQRPHESVDEWLTTLNTLVTQIDALTSARLDSALIVTLFVRGLKEPIREHVQTAQHTAAAGEFTLAIAAKVARTREITCKSVKRPAQINTAAVERMVGKAVGEHIQNLSAMWGGQSNRNAPPSAPPSTLPDRATCREQNLCYKCGKSGHLSRECRRKN